MGCQISAGPHQINTSRAAWLVAEMCEPWFDRERDTDGDGWHQEWVRNSSIRSADAVIPHTASEYVSWRARMGLDAVVDFTDDEFSWARRFVSDVAKTDEDAALSH